MTITDYLLLGLSQYGQPLLFAVVLVSALGVPLPATLLLLTAGALTTHGDLGLGMIIAGAAAAAVLGDQLGYVAGRWGSRPLIDRLARWSGAADRLGQAERLAQRWGGASIFLSRWLLTPLGAVVNVASGIARYSWPAFLALDLLGELLWVTLYVGLGRLMGDQMQALSDQLGNLTWLAIALLGAILIGRLLSRYLPDAKRLMARVA
jgi:membrane-associated protein